MAKNLVPFLLLTLAVIIVTARRTPRPVEASITEPDPSSESEPGPPAAGSHGPFGPGGPHGPRSSAAANERPLTDMEQRDKAIHIPPQACAEIGRKLNEFAGIPVGDHRQLRAQVMCMRQGNVAWMKCIEKAKTVDEVRTCHRRLLD